jgi:protease II
VEDPYAWMANVDWKAVLAKGEEALPPEVRTLIEQQNAYTEREMERTKSMQRDSLWRKSIRLINGPFYGFARRAV